MNKKINGKLLAKAILDRLKKRVKKLKKKKLTPCLAIFSAGNNSASASYIRQKGKAARAIGVGLKHFKFKKETSYQEFAEKLNETARDPKFSGVIIQKPLPVTLNHASLDSIILLEKDVDGTNPKTPFISPVARAVLRTLDLIRIGGKGKRILTLKAFPSEDLTNWLSQHHILLIGRGKTGGKPIAKTLTQRKIKFLITHRGTVDLTRFAKKSDIIISCVGKEIVKKEMLKQGAILIGVGIRKDEKGKFRGDFNEKEIEDAVSFYTPTPGGTGPLTVASLMENLVSATEKG